ncbi:MAG: FAD-dependent oxidoreductase [Nitrospirota bacterium]|jgi:thioredoxin reductase (NADPH)
MAEQILTAEMREQLKQSFALLKEPVTLMLFTREGVNDQYNDILRELLREISSMEERIRLEEHSVGDEASRRYGVERSPTLLVSPGTYDIRFTGAPLGEEGSTLLGAVVMASTGRGEMAEDSRKRLQRTKEKRRVRVFVSPTCPYCPQQATYALAAAVERPDLVSAEVVEIYENRDLAEKFGALSVPKTFINDRETSSGLESEESFMEAVVRGRAAEHIPAVGPEEIKDLDVAIVGGGPAGLTAAIYAERSGLRTAVFEGSVLGGQVAVTPVVENYPGFQMITGKALVDLMTRHAMQYAPLLTGAAVKDVRRTEKGFRVVATRGTYNARAVILATGATHRTLGAPGERRLTGRGVSYCATCDGYLYREGRSVMVVGGGNSALTDALYLDSLGAHVRILHRRETLRAEERLQQGVFQRNIEVMYRTRIVEILGKDKVQKVKLEDLATGETRTVKTDAVFVSIGYEPVNDIARKLGLELDREGYVRTDDRQRTAVPFVYAAGDVTGGVKQIAAAAGQGSSAAISAFEDLSNPYWRRPGQAAAPGAEGA